MFSRLPDRVHQSGVQKYAMSTDNSRSRRNEARQLSHNPIRSFGRVQCRGDKPQDRHESREAYSCYSVGSAAKRAEGDHRWKPIVVALPCVLLLATLSMHCTYQTCAE